jgi:uncharacterized iron-regulated protein
MMRLRLMALLIFWVPVACQTSPPPTGLSLYDLSARRELAPSQVAKRIVAPRLVLVGEHHNNAAHHEAQLAVIQFLHAQGVKVAVGLEMFRQDHQATLDRWVAGELNEAAFIEAYLDNWNLDWRLYRDIFRFTRDNRLPMVGLNVSREITRQVAHGGFQSLNPRQRHELGAITCDVSADYMAYIRRAFGGHGHGHGGITEFARFCEAQLVWDTVMAVKALEYLGAHPQRMLVLIAGSGHVQRPAIPAQFRSRSTLPYLILLPETAGSFERRHMDATVADYLILQP